MNGVKTSMFDPDCKHDDMCKDVDCNCDCHYITCEMIDGVLRLR